jgi:hypothetical protein
MTIPKDWKIEGKYLKTYHCVDDTIEVTITEVNDDRYVYRCYEDKMGICFATTMTLQEAFEESDAYIKDVYGDVFFRNGGL